MKKMAVSSPLLVVFAMLLAVSGCGKNNIFAWAHQAGSSTDVNSLESDASSALTNKDYSAAKEYYLKILASDPNNSMAIYGYSTATLAQAGLDVGSLVANLISQSGSAPQRLAPAIAFAASSSSSGENLLPESIRARIAILKPAVDDVIPRLAKIVKGQADGKIPKDNPDVNLNLGLCLVIRAAMTLDSLVVFDTNYKASINSGLTHDQVQSAAHSAAEDISSAYVRLQVIVNKLTQAKSLSNVFDDMKTMFDNLKSSLKSSTRAIDVTDITLGTDYL